MSKKVFLRPTILRAWGDEGSEVGPGSGGSTGPDDIMVCDFEEWLEMYGDDFDGDDDIDMDDYKKWWIDSGLSPDDWMYPEDPLNP